eukprot:gene8977-10528_t
MSLLSNAPNNCRVLEASVTHCSSESEVHKSSNALLDDTYRVWSTDQPTDLAVIEFQFPEPTIIKAIDVMNAGSAFIEILVGHSSWEETEFQVLVPLTNFLSMSDSKNKVNRTRVKRFDKLSSQTSHRKWEKVRVVCKQPFNNDNIGLSLIRFYALDRPTRKSTSALDTSMLSETTEADTSVNNISTTSTNVDTPLKLSISMDRDAEMSDDVTAPTDLSSDVTQADLSALASTPQRRKSSSKSILTNMLPGETISELPVAAASSKLKLSEPDMDDLTDEDIDLQVIVEPKMEAKYVTPFNQLMKGVVLVIGGIVNPQKGELREKALEMGADYQADWCREATHLVTPFAGTPKFDQAKKAGGSIVAPKWIEECYKTKTRLPIKTYQVSKQYNSAKSPSEPAVDSKKANKAISTSSKKKTKKKKKKSSSDPFDPSDTEDEDDGLPNAYDLEDDFIDKDVSMDEYESEEEVKKTNGEEEESSASDPEDTSDLYKDGLEFLKRTYGSDGIPEHLLGKKPKHIVKKLKMPAVEGNYVNGIFIKCTPKKQTKPQSPQYSPEIASTPPSSRSNKQMFDDDLLFNDQTQEISPEVIKRELTRLVSNIGSVPKDKDIPMDDDTDEDEEIKPEFFSPKTTSANSSPVKSSNKSNGKTNGSSTTKAQAPSKIIPQKPQIKGKEYIIDPLPTFFDGIEFYLSVKDDSLKKQISRYITAYKGDPCSSTFTEFTCDSTKTNIESFSLGSTAAIKSELPSSFNNFLKLKSLSLNHANYIIPPSFWDLSTTRTQLSYVQIPTFASTLPDSWTDLTGLRSLVVHHYGTSEFTFNKFDKFTSVYVLMLFFENGMLRTPFPTSLFNSKMTQLVILGDAYAGPSVFDFSNASSLVSIKLSNNLLTGSLPEWVCTANSIFVANNMLSGNVPDCYLCEAFSQDIKNALANNQFSNFNASTTYSCRYIDIPTTNFGWTIPYVSGQPFPTVVTPNKLWRINFPSGSGANYLYTYSFHGNRITQDIPFGYLPPTINSLTVINPSTLSISGTNFNFWTNYVTVSIAGFVQPYISQLGHEYIILPNPFTNGDICAVVSVSVRGQSTTKSFCTLSSTPEVDFPYPLIVQSRSNILEFTGNHFGIDKSLVSLQIGDLQCDISQLTNNYIKCLLPSSVGHNLSLNLTVGSYSLFNPNYTSSTLSIVGDNFPIKPNVYVKTHNQKEDQGYNFYQLVIESNTSTLITCVTDVGIVPTDPFWRVQNTIIVLRQDGSETILNQYDYMILPEINAISSPLESSTLKIYGGIVNLVNGTARLVRESDNSTGSLACSFSTSKLVTPLTCTAGADNPALTSGATDQSRSYHVVFSDSFTEISSNSFTIFYIASHITSDLDITLNGHSIPSNAVLHIKDYQGVAPLAVVSTADSVTGLQTVKFTAPRSFVGQDIIVWLSSTKSGSTYVSNSYTASMIKPSIVSVSMSPVQGSIITMIGRDYQVLDTKTNVSITIGDRPCLSPSIDVNGTTSIITCTCPPGYGTGIVARVTVDGYTVGTTFSYLAPSILSPNVTSNILKFNVTNADPSSCEITICSIKVTDFSVTNGSVQVKLPLLTNNKCNVSLVTGNQQSTPVAIIIAPIIESVAKSESVISITEPSSSSTTPLQPLCNTQTEKDSSQLAGSPQTICSPSTVATPPAMQMSGPDKTFMDSSDNVQHQHQMIENEMISQTTVSDSASSSTIPVQPICSPTPLSQISDASTTLMDSSHNVIIEKEVIPEPIASESTPRSTTPLQPICNTQTEKDSSLTAGSTYICSPSESMVVSPVSEMSNRVGSSDKQPIIEMDMISKPAISWTGFLAFADDNGVSPFVLLAATLTKPSSLDTPLTWPDTIVISGLCQENESITNQLDQAMVFTFNPQATSGFSDAEYNDFIKQLNEDNTHAI